MTTPVNDSAAATGLMAWAGLVLTAIGGLFGHLHLRVNRLEDRVAENHTTIQDELGTGDDKLRDRIDEMRRDDADFRERLLREMANKDDIRELRASVERLTPGGAR